MNSLNLLRLEIKKLFLIQSSKPVPSLPFLFIQADFADFRRDSRDLLRRHLRFGEGSRAEDPRSEREDRRREQGSP